MKQEIRALRAVRASLSAVLDICRALTIDGPDGTREALAREYEQRFLRQVYMELMVLQHLVDFNESDPRLDGIRFLTRELSDKIGDMKVKVGSACDLLGKILRRERKRRWN